MNYTAVVVTDQERYGAALAEILNRLYGHQAVHLRNFPEVDAYIDRGQLAECRLVITDLDLGTRENPGDGEDVIDAMKQSITPPEACRFILTSGYGYCHRVQAVLRLWPDVQFVPKPFNLTQVAALVQPQ